jgi:hypothetical protein
MMKLREVDERVTRGTAASTTFAIVALWESAKALGHAFLSPENRPAPQAIPITPSLPPTSSRR